MKIKIYDRNAAEQEENGVKVVKLTHGGTVLNLTKDNGKMIVFLNPTRFDIDDVE